MCAVTSVLMWDHALWTPQLDVGGGSIRKGGLLGRRVPIAQNY